MDCIGQESKLPDGLHYEDYMHICFAMIDVADLVVLMKNWESSTGAKREFEYASNRGKIVWEE